MEPARARAALLRQVFAHIDERFREPELDLSHIARAVHFSPAYLTTLVKETTGQSLHQWIIDRRISAARRIVAETDEPLATVARELGFCDASYFCRSFARVIGVTPGEWRAQHRPLRHFRSEQGAVLWHAAEIDYASAGYASVREFRRRAGSFHAASEVAQAAVETAFATFAPASAQFIWHDEARGAWVPGYRRSRRALPAVPEADDTRGVYPHVIGGQTICAVRLEHDEIPYLRLLGRLGFRAFIIASVWHQARCFGAFIVLESREREFSNHEQSLAYLLGRYAGAVMAPF